MLLRRNERNDRDDAHQLLREATEQYGVFGMPKHVELAEQMLQGS
ncbi:MAG: hypothetical protein O6913_06765 [Chloroflexi bacterium]|nr:hypothetical protein [Chloroflexota bacterium]